MWQLSGMPREKWIIGQGNASLSNVFLVHAEEPISFASIVEDDSVDAIKGLTHDLGNDFVLAELHVFNDSLPLDELIFEAAEVVRNHPLVISQFELGQ